MAPGVPVAFKLIFAPDINRETIESFFQEAAILRSLTHPNIVRLVGVCVAPPSLAHVLELCDGSLFDVIQQRKSEREKTNSRVMDKKHLDWFYDVARQCAAAVSFLHSRTPMAILHRDIKSLNFLTVGHCIKLADMDLAMFWADDSSTEGDDSETASGSDLRTSSEVGSERKYSFAATEMSGASNYGTGEEAILHLATKTMQSSGSKSAHVFNTRYRFRRRLTKKAWRKSKRNKGAAVGGADALHLDIVGTSQWVASEFS